MPPQPARSAADILKDLSARVRKLELRARADQVGYGSGIAPVYLKVHATPGVGFPGDPTAGLVYWIFDTAEYPSYNWPHTFQDTPDQIAIPEPGIYQITVYFSVRFTGGFPVYSGHIYATDPHAVNQFNTSGGVNTTNANDSITFSDTLPLLRNSYVRIYGSFFNTELKPDSTLTIARVCGIPEEWPSFQS